MNYWYIVLVGERTLESQCEASQYRGHCAHRQAVHNRLGEDRTTKREAKANAAAKWRRVLIAEASQQLEEEVAS